jgi:choline dehydrogenase-like flavoprotein
MFRQESDVANDEILRADLCIVGTGPAGLTLARELAGEKIQIAMIESGGLEVDEATRSLRDGPTGSPPQAYALRERRFGGTSTLWGALAVDGSVSVRYVKMEEIDFETREGMPHTGWPFRLRHLEPYYERAQRLLRIAPFEPAKWANGEDARPLPLEESGLIPGVVQFGPSEVFHKESRELLAASTQVVVYLNLNAICIETDQAGTAVTRIRLATLDGKRAWVEAKTFVLATGGIENARLLLLSNETVKTGLANQHDVVGRYFMDHFCQFAGILYPADRSLFDRLAFYDMRAPGSVSGMGIIRLSPELMRANNLIGVGTYLLPKQRTYGHQRVGSAYKAILGAKLRKQTWPPGALPDRKRGYAELVSGMAGNLMVSIPARLYRKLVVGRPYPWTSINDGGWSQLPHKSKDFGILEVQQLFEQAPHPDNRVMLCDEPDRLGCRKAVIDRRLRPFDIENVNRVNEILRDAFARTGVGRFVVDKGLTSPYLTSLWQGSAHHMGTTRMHDDPKQGVVDSDCKVHGMANLLVAGSSVFPSGGWANPTLTIVAMSMRLADHLKNRSVK